MKRLRLIGALACAAALLAVVPALAPASVQVGSSGWQWGNPLPQGNTLRSISFAGADGYAAGDFGTLLHTTDGGATWSGLLSGTFTNLTEVQAIDARRRSSPRGGCVARRSDDGGATFTRVAFTPGRVAAARSRSRPAGSSTASTGFLVLTDGTVLRTDNNGDTFAQKNPLPGTRAPGGDGDARRPALPRPTRSASARPPTARSTAPPTAPTRGAWSATRTRAVHSFFFLDANNGFAVGDGSLFLVTKDGGATWTPKDIGIPPTNLRSIQCATADALRHDDRAGNGARAHRRRRRRRRAGHALARTRSSRAAFASPTRIAATGATGATAVSDDAGLTFTPIGGRLSGTLLAGARRRPGRDGLRARATTARWPRRPTAARRGRAATSRPPRTSSTSPSRRRRSATRWTPRAACSAPTTAARPGRRSTPARRRAPAAARRAEHVDGHPSPARAACAARPTAATRSRPSPTGRRQGQARRRSTAPAARCSPTASARSAALDRPRQARGRRCTSRAP